MHGPEHVNQIFLLDTTKAPDNQHTGVAFEKLNMINYPDLAESELNEDLLPFLVRKCAVDRLNAFRVMKRTFDRLGRFDEKGAILSGLSSVVSFFCLCFRMESDTSFLCWLTEGPAGAGKSYVLYHVVQFCRATG